ncbi:MAG: hypothetical protein U0359_36420 [Byssovorax sp.]
MRTHPKRHTPPGVKTPSYTKEARLRGLAWGPLLATKKQDPRATHQDTRRPLQRLLLASAAALTLAAPALAGGCGGATDRISQIDSLRVLAVVPAVLDKDHPTPDVAVTGSYANPGDKVTFSMSYYDGYVDPANPGADQPKPQILWLAGCYDPPGDTYYGCYSQLAEVLKNFDPANPDLNYVGFGPTFTTQLPDDIISRREKPSIGPYYGIAYVFFAVCAGTIKAIPPSGTGQAGSFPLGCFDEKGNQLNADRFVPGYTQIYAFDDKRTNQNPKVKGMHLFTSTGLDVSRQELTDDPTAAVSVSSCGVSEDDRNAPPSCGKADPLAECAVYTVDIDVDEDVAELDPDSTSADGKPLKEVVWVDYFADKGDFTVDVKLVSDATDGLLYTHSSKFIPPAESGLVTIWAVVHDARGGSTVVTRYLRVE